MSVQIEENSKTSIHFDKRLLVIGEVYLDVEKGRLVNAAFQTILTEYSAVFTEVIYVGPASRDGVIFEQHNLRCIGTTIYTKKWLDRLTYVVRAGRRNSFFLQLADHRPDIIEIRIPSLFTLLSHRALEKLGRPLVVYIAGDWQSAISETLRSAPLWLGRFFDRLQWPLIRKSVVVTAGRALAEKYAHLADCHVYRGTTHRAIIRREPAFPLKRLLFVGQFEPRKRIEDAIQALSILIAEGLDATLTIVGDGPLKERLRCLVRELDLVERVTFTGYVWDSNELSAIFLESDLLLLPSLSEGSPKVVPEAMAHGVIPIAVDGVGAINDIIRHGKNGLLAQPLDPSHIASLVLQLARSPQTVRTLVEGGYAYAAAHCLPKEVERQWSSVALRLGLNA